MKTTITQISNIFNLLSQLDVRLFNYHFGYRYDINQNITNNFDPANDTGRLFPAVSFDVPDNVKYIDGIDYVDIQEEMQVTLYFDDLQGYNNDGSLNVLNPIEQWQRLKQIGEDFIANFRYLFEDKYGAGYVGKPTFVPRANLYNDRLITWEVSFQLTHAIPCTDVQYQIDPDDFPNTLDEDDLERTTGTPPTACDRIISQLNDDLLNNCVLPLYDFANVTTQDALSPTQVSDLKAAFCTPSTPVTQKSVTLNGINQNFATLYSAQHEIERTDLFTIDCWIKIPSYSGGSMLSKYDIIGVRRGWLFRHGTGGKLAFDLKSDESMGNELQVVSASFLPLNVWTHVAVTYVGTSLGSGFKMYINGIEDTVITNIQNLTGTTIDPTNVLRVGGITNAPAYFNGQIYNPRLWVGVAMSGAEIAQLAVPPATPTSEPILLYPNFLKFGSYMGSNGLFGTTVWVMEDYSGNVPGVQSSNVPFANVTTDIPT